MSGPEMNRSGKLSNFMSNAGASWGWVWPGSRIRGRKKFAQTGSNMKQDVPGHVIVAAFNDKRGAGQALDMLKELARDHLVIGVGNAAVLRRDEDDILRITQISDLRTGGSAAIGGFVGRVAGLLAGPIGWAALGGASIGAMAFRLCDAGFPEKRLRQIGGSLTPGTSALIAEVEPTWIAGWGGCWPEWAPM